MTTQKKIKQLKAPIYHTDSLCEIIQKINELVCRVNDQNEKDLIIEEYLWKNNPQEAVRFVVKNQTEAVEKFRLKIQKHKEKFNGQATRTRNKHCVPNRNVSC